MHIPDQLKTAVLHVFVGGKMKGHRSRRQKWWRQIKTVVTANERRGGRGAVVDFEYIKAHLDENERINITRDEAENEENDNNATGIFDTGATSGVAPEQAKRHLRATSKQATKIFQMPMGDQAAASEVMEMTHKLRQPANDMNIVPGV